jgi:endonuclease YncB( thermonuclease family)
MARRSSPAAPLPTDTASADEAEQPAGEDVRAEALADLDAARQRVVARFSAPCNIGPPLEGVGDGDTIEVAGDSPNAGRWTVVKVDADWMQVAPRLITEHAPRAGCTVEWVA